VPHMVKVPYALPTVTKLCAHGALFVERGDVTRDHDRPCIAATPPLFAMRMRRIPSEERSVCSVWAET
jgi:hypothetical protein